MTSPVATRMKADWLRLLAHEGRDASLLKVAQSGAYDPNAGTQTETEATHAARVIVTNYRDKDIDGTRITTRDRRVVISPSVAVDPEVNDRLTVGSTTYTIMDVNPHELSELTLGWVVQARLT